MANLTACGLRKSYGRTVALAGVDLTVRSGSLTAVLGPSGCGKTTLLRCVAGFESCDAGDIIIAGRSVTTLPPHRRRVGIVPQEGALFPHLNVFDNVAYGLDRAVRRSGRVEAVLALVGLEGLAPTLGRPTAAGRRRPSARPPAAGRSARRTIQCSRCRASRRPTS